MSPVTDWAALAKDAKESENKYEPAPENTYNLTITEVKPDVSKEGNQKFSATMVIDSGPFKGKKLWHDFVVARTSKNGLRIFFQNMAVFGMPFDYFGPNTQETEIVNNLVNKRLSADVIVDTYNPDKPKNKIDKGWTIKAPTGPSELDLPSAAGVPGGSNPAATSAPPPVNNYQAAPPQYQQPPVQQQPQYQQPPVQQQPQYQQPPVQQSPQAYQEQPLANAVEDPWQTPQSPPPPPSNANWGAPPPPPPGLS